MANGDAAAAAGLETVPASGPTGKARMGYDWLNRILDLLVTRKFGTGQLADGAVTTVKLADGGVTPAKLSGAVPVANGGTGATTAAAARTNLGAQAALGFTPVKNGPGNQMVIQRKGSELVAQVLIDNTLLGDLVVQGGGDLHTGGGRLNSIGSRNFTVSSNYASAYMDGSNWLGITPSAERFKQDIHPHRYSLDQLMAIQLVAYRLRKAVEEDPSASGEVGVIAEQLEEIGLQEFVVYDAEGRTQSVAYERLWLVALSGLQELVTIVDGLGRSITALEAHLGLQEGDSA